MFRGCLVVGWLLPRWSLGLRLFLLFLCKDFAFGRLGLGILEGPLELGDRPGCDVQCTAGVLAAASTATRRASATAGSGTARSVSSSLETRGRSAAGGGRARGGGRQPASRRAMAEGGGDGGDEAALREEISRLRAELGASEDSRAREREELEGRALEVRQKAKDHIEQLQGKMRQVIERKDERLSEVEAQKAALESELAAARAAADAAAESRGVAGPLGDALAEQLQAAARERDEAREECAAMKVKLESLEAQFSALSATPEGQSGDMAEVARAQRESEAKMQEVVRRAKEHVMQVQAKLATSMTENKELSERYQEVNEAYKQQQEKVTKYKQLMAQANARIEESDENVRELKDALSKSQAQRLTMASQMGSMQSNFVPPTADEVSQRGGVLLAVETPDGEDVWCLVRRPDDGGASAEASSEATADQGAQHCWHLLSQLEGVEGPVPLQRRWKGEVSALRAQMSRFKKKSEDVQEAFDAYKEKANAALQNGAVQSQEMLLRDRRLEELGEQLQATSLELRRSEEHKDRALADLGEARRRQQEASSRALDLERALERCQREGEEKAEAAAARGASAFEARKVELEQQWYEKERGYQRDLDLRRTQTESLKEEIERLNARVFSQQAAAAALRAEASAPGPEVVERLIRALDEQTRAFAARSRPSLVDSEGVGRPAVFNDDEARFSEWAQKTEFDLLGVEQALEQALEWALDQGGEIAVQQVLESFGPGSAHVIDGVVGLNLQGKTALSNLAEGEGRSLLRAILAPARVKMDELGSALQTWEYMVSRCNKKSLKLGEPAVADDFLRSALEAPVPDDLEKHLHLNASRLEKCAEGPHHGRQKFEGYCDNCVKYGRKKKGEDDARRCITGRGSDARKMSASALQVREKGRQLIWLSADEGHVVPKDSRVGKMLQKELDCLARRFGDDSPLPVHRERGVYNFYMKVERAGAHPYPAKFFEGYLKERGWKRCASWSDGERRRVVLKAVADQMRAVEIVAQKSPVGGHAANGEAENAVKEVKRIVRVQKQTLEERIGTRLPLHHPIWTWLPRHAAARLSRCRIGEDGRSAEQRRTGRRWAKSALEFGERIHAGLAQEQPRSGMTPKMAEDWYVGHQTRTGSLPTMTTRGGSRGKTYNKMTAEERWKPAGLDQARQRLQRQQAGASGRRACHAAGGSAGAAAARRGATSQKAVLSAEELEDITHLSLELPMGAVDGHELCPPPQNVALARRLGLRPGASATYRAHPSPSGTEHALQEQNVAKRHVEVACESYLRQMARGRHFLHEHPHDDSSWETPGILELLEQDAVERATAGPVPAEPDAYEQGRSLLEDSDGHWDDVNGGWLDPAMVRCEAYPLMWLDTNKGDNERPNCPSRIVVREKRGQGDEGRKLPAVLLFHAMPPLEAVKMLGGLMVQNRSSDRGEPLGMRFFDLSRAHLHGQAERAVRVELPEEEQDMSATWQRDYTAVLKQDGHEPGKANPALVYKKVDDCRSLIHGDDFCAMGDDDAQDQIEHGLRKKYDLKEFRVLRATGCPGEGRFEVEADPRRAEMIFRDMDLEQESAKTPDVPGLKKEEAEAEERFASPPLVGGDVRLHRSATVRASHLAPDRADIGDAVKNLASHMQSSKQVDMARLKNLARYLKGRPRVAQSFAHVMVDSDNAGDEISRRSTVGQVVFVGCQAVKHACNLVQVIGLSSGEHEYCAISASACTGLGIQGLLEDWQAPSKVKAVSDSSAARGCASRRGAGELKRVQTRYLRVQGRIAMQHLELGKIGTADNRGDLLAKPLGRKEIDVHMKGINQEHGSGRAAKGLLLK
ncbi:unnamed protein product [Prorocentrum cordatum]|uniref:Uncharacterized protein n=1 Tax=Prorocentrum cordatum TaxID=2364126 RepID=A0ABN9PKA2_9DINO|nr:unnamed protein product [Polarella glacialis]